MADMWRHRAPPTPLNFDAIRDGTFEGPGPTVANGSTQANGSVTISDQRSLSLEDNVELFVAR